MQQQCPVQADEGPRFVVASLPTALLHQLHERGVARSTAERLVSTTAPEQVTRQVEIYDWLRDQRPDDERLTPGRLRRMIEEDWPAPAGYLSPADRAARVEAAERQARGRAQAAASAVRQAARAGARRQALLEAIGLTEADQALWARIAQADPPLPQPFRTALFHAPRGDEPAAVIFQDRVALARATGPAHAATRARIAARVADLCHRPGIQVHYLVYEEVLRLLASDDADPGAAAAPAAAGPG